MNIGHWDHKLSADMQVIETYGTHRIFTVTTLILSLSTHAMLCTILSRISVAMTSIYLSQRPYILSTLGCTLFALMCNNAINGQQKNTEDRLKISMQVCMFSNIP